MSKLRLATLPNAASRKWNPIICMLNQGLDGEGFEVGDLTLETLNCEKWDLLHIHWFDGYTYFRNPFKILLRCKRLLNGIDRQKRMGAKLIYTAHDVIGHDTPWRQIENWFLREFMKRVDGTIFLSKVSIPTVRQRFPVLQGPTAVIPHSDYGRWYTDTVSQAQARRKCGIPLDAFVITHVGLIKRYKNVPALIEAFSQLEGNFRLLVGGRILVDALRAEIESLAAKDERVILKLQHLEDEDMQHFFRAADLVALPYRSILNSGSAMLGLTFDKPVLVPNTGSMPELVENVSPEWVRAFDGEFDSSTLAAAVDWVKATDRSGKPPLENLTVERIAQMHAQFYRSVLDNSCV